MQVKVYAYGFRAGEARADNPDSNIHFTSLGWTQYGMRYDEVILEADARKRLVEAYKLTQWYEQSLGCRLEPGVELPDVGQN